MRLRSIAATVGCAALALFGIAAPARAATIAVGNAATLVTELADAEPGDVLQLEASFGVDAADGHLAVPVDTDVVLDLNGQNLAVSAAEGLAGIEVGPTSELLIQDTVGGGSLAVAGGDEAAGIGGSNEQTSGTITIAGGEIVAIGGASGAGIGGGRWGDGGTTVINGGTVAAYGGPYGAGIGGGINSDAGTVTITGGTVTAISNPDGSPQDPASGAGIGGAGNGRSGTITISGGVVTATAAGGSAGIGGGGLSGGSNGGIITITEGTVIATGGAMGGAGIGAANGRSAGPVIIEGGTVTATGGASPGDAGPGIGQGAAGEMTVTISGGTVTAVGGAGDDDGAAGIGGASYRSGLPTTITGGTVVAEGRGGGAGIGGGLGTTEFATGSGSTISVGSDAVVTVSAEGGANAIGQGLLGAEFGSLSNAGELTVSAGSTLTIPSGTTVPNSGTLIAEGEVVNNGTIANTGTVASPENVSVHHYLLQFDPTSADVDAPSDQRVFAATLADAGLVAPGLSRAGYEFGGWFLDTSGVGDALDGDTVLGLGADGPLTQTWVAVWAAISPPAWSGDPAVALTVGTETSVTFPVSGAESVTQTGGTLPEGIAADVTSAGVTLAGTPAPGTTGEHTVEFTANNGGGEAVLTVTLTVDPVAQEPPTDAPTSDAPTSAPAAPIGGQASPPVLAEAGADPALPAVVAAVLIFLGLGTALATRHRRHL